jgi:hypothetical protein
MSINSKVNLNWNNIKTVKTNFDVGYTYVEDNDYYYIWISVNGREFKCDLKKDGGSDVLDWENNYKALSNQINSNAIKTSLEDKYVPKVFKGSADVVIGATQTTVLINENIEGKLDEIMVRVQDKDMDVILEIDGVEVYSFNLGELKDDYKLVV